MTDRVSTLTVILREDVREDDVQAVRGAIQMLSPVASVIVGKPVDINDSIVRDRLRMRIAAQAYNLIAGRKVLTEE